MGQSVVSNYLRGVYSPSRIRANEFAALTDGFVPTSAWDVVALARELRTHAECMSELRGNGHAHAWKMRRKGARGRAA